MPQKIENTYNPGLPVCLHDNVGLEEIKGGENSLWHCQSVHGSHQQTYGLSACRIESVCRSGSENNLQQGYIV